MVEAEFERIDFCPYQALGLENNSNVSDRQVKQSFRKLALKYHPDRNRDDPHARTKFERIKLASEILLNPTLREKLRQLELAKEEQKARVASSDEQRRQFMKDLQQREAEYAEALKQARAKGQNSAATSTAGQKRKYTEASAGKHESEIDKIINETR